MHNIKLNNDLKFICDFEVAEINAIQNAFANEYNCIQLCYYHYCKNNYEKMDEYAKKNCQFTRDLYELIELLPLINLNSTKRIIEFLQKISSYSNALSEYMCYFINTYTKKFKIEQWNISGKTMGHRATNNMNESFNRKLNSKLPKSPTIKNFIDVIKQLDQEYMNKYNNYNIDNNLVPDEFKTEIEHDEVQRFCNCIDALSNKYPFFAQMLKEEETKYFDVIDESKYKICEICIELPVYDMKHYQ